MTNVHSALPMTTGGNILNNIHLDDVFYRTCLDNTYSQLVSNHLDQWILTQHVDMKIVYIHIGFIETGGWMDRWNMFRPISATRLYREMDMKNLHNVSPENY